ncbi:MAG: hypothetical protein JKY37_04120 [Nannocystaceae bacterium]|nr:hypothetical protein [Nannocystaceae bacterium]
MIEVDDSAFPFVVVRFIGDNTDQELEEYFARLDEVRAAAPHRYVVMLDATHAKLPTGRQLRMHANWLRKRMNKIRRSSLASAYVVPSPAVRVALKALFTLQAMETPYVVVDTVADARAVLQAYLDRELGTGPTA